MSSSADMNIVLGQGSAVKEVHNIRKQQLDLNQGFVQQDAEALKNRQRVSVQDFDNQNKVEIRKKKKKDHREQRKKKAKTSSEPDRQEGFEATKGSLIDIKV